ncbi:MAG: hypothetical protein F4X40_09410 [Chloroflexi bacterium]|nr:hypothetical protein [Chloroflexota bacterium]
MRRWPFDRGRTRRPDAGSRPIGFPDLPAGYDRHRAALDIVDPGAFNPSGVALSLHTACRQVVAAGMSQHEHPAVRLIGLQFAYLLGVDRILDTEEYGRLLEHCRAPAEERKRTDTEIAA